MPNENELKQERMHLAGEWPEVERRQAADRRALMNQVFPAPGAETIDTPEFADLLDNAWNHVSGWRQAIITHISARMAAALEQGRREGHVTGRRNGVRDANADAAEAMAEMETALAAAREQALEEGRNLGLAQVSALFTQPYVQHDGCDIQEAIRVLKSEAVAPVVQDGEAFDWDGALADKTTAGTKWQWGVFGHGKRIAATASAQDAELIANALNRAAPVAVAPVAGEGLTDPMDWPLPCEITVGAGTFAKGVKLRALVARMNVMNDMILEGRRSAKPAERQPQPADKQEQS